MTELHNSDWHTISYKTHSEIHAEKQVKSESNIKLSYSQ